MAGYTQRSQQDLSRPIETLPLPSDRGHGAVGRWDAALAPPTVLRKAPTPKRGARSTQHSQRGRFTACRRHHRDGEEASSMTTDWRKERNPHRQTKPPHRNRSRQGKETCRPWVPRCGGRLAAATPQRRRSVAQSRAETQASAQTGPRPLVVGAVSPYRQSAAGR